MIVTACYAGINALVLVWLASRVIAARNAAGIGIGDGGDPALARLVRGHGNAAETIPVALILLGLAESLAAPAWVLHLVGIALTLGRVVHAAHFSGLAPALGARIAGMALTLSAIALCALGLIGRAALRIF